MPKPSAGILVYRIKDGVLQVLLAHPGGPYWAKKDAGVWSVFKGEIEEHEEPIAAAQREFKEETSKQLPDTPLIPLGEVKRKDGKVMHVWAVQADYDPLSITSNTFEMEWPPKSGQMQKYPENDRAAWFDAASTPGMMHSAQHTFIERLIDALKAQSIAFSLGSSEDHTATSQPSLF
jgi:predicted NUDIX family NTP pyrophosphohydrolase